MIAVLLLAFLQLFDGITTLLILESPAGGTERNPFLKKLFKRYGVRKTLGVKALAVSAIGLGLYLAGYEPVVWLLCIWYMVVVLHNVYQLRKE